MRVPHALALLIAGLVLAIASPAAADDEKPAPKVKVPPYSVEDIAARDAERPEGWEPVTTAGVVPATAPSGSGDHDPARRNSIRNSVATYVVSPGVRQGATRTRRMVRFSPKSTPKVARCSSSSARATARL